MRHAETGAGILDVPELRSPGQHGQILLGMRNSAAVKRFEAGLQAQRLQTRLLYAAKQQRLYMPLLGCTHWSCLLYAAGTMRIAYGRCVADPVASVR